MKALKLPVLVAGALLFGLCSAHAQNTLTARLSANRLESDISPLNQATTLISLPGTGQTYIPDTAGTGWIHLANVTYTYDALGRLTDRTEVNANTNANEYKLTYLYDSQGNITEYGDYLTDSNNQWQRTGNSRKLVYTYNAINQPAEIIRQIWDESTLSYRNAYRLVRSYNSGGFLEQETHYNWNTNNWVTLRRDNYIFANPNNPPTEIIFEDFENGNFINDERYADIYWHRFDISQALFPVMQSTSYTGHEWNGSVWISTMRSTGVYDQYGGSVETIETNNNGTWKFSRRFFTNYDNYSNYTSERSELWVANSWALHWQREHVLSYNSNLDITERIYQNDFSGSGVPVVDHKETYDNFIYVSAAPNTVTELPVTIYPNPTHNSLYISGEVTEHSEITFTDITGRAVSTRKLPAGSTKIDVSSLTSGTYILRINNNKGSKIQKVVKL